MGLFFNFEMTNLNVQLKSETMQKKIIPVPTEPSNSQAVKLNLIWSGGLLNTDICIFVFLSQFPD